jgi:hypothetical protein
MAIVVYDRKTGLIWGIGLDGQEEAVRKIADDKIKKMEAQVRYDIIDLTEAIQISAEASF